MKLFRSISFKIWIYFTAILIVALGVVVFYFPNQQKKSIEKYRGKELKELCRTIALGVEFSLDINDFQKLNKSIKYYQNKKNDFDFLVVLQQDSLTKQESVFAKIHDDELFDYFKVDTSLYLINFESFTSDVMDGKVIIGLSKKRIAEEVQKTNYPVYLILLGILIITVFLFYVVARSISLPINKAIKNAQFLQNNEFESFDIIPKKSKDEITLLQNALVSLKDSLLFQKQENKNILDNLEQKILERTENLNQTLNRLNEAQEIASLSYFTYFPDKNEFKCADNLEMIMGLNETKINSFDQFKEAIDVDYLNDIEVSLLTNNQFNIEVKIKQYDKVVGTNKWLAITGQKVKDIQTSSIVVRATIQDITFRKNAEAELNKLSLAVKNSFNSIIITDLNQKILWVNDSLLKMTGYTREEVIGNTPRMFQFEETCIDTRRIIRENLLALRTFKTEICNSTKYGQKYWLELYIQPLLNEKGTAEGFMAIEIDITDRKEKEQLISKYIKEIEEKQKEISSINEGLEQKVLEKTKDLELSFLQLQKSQDEIIKKEKLATLGLLVAGIAHEINTPLGAIKASADNLDFLFLQEFNQLISLLPLDEFKLSLDIFNKLKNHQTISTILQRQNAKHLEQEIKIKYPQLLTSSFLSKELATLGFNELNEDVQHIILNNYAEDIIKTIKLLVNIQRSIKTINEGAVKSSKIIKALNTYSHGTNEAQVNNFNLKENFENIITLFWNKIKYHAVIKNNIPDDIFVSGLEDELAQVWSNIINNALQASNNKCVITIDYTDNNNQHIINISNDGPKIPDEVIEKIFDEFFTTKKRGEGTGLGLNIVKNIVEKHLGKISCTSNEKLTTFTIVLPKEFNL
jgi:PAS domain S-box-containing protein